MSKVKEETELNQEIQPVVELENQESEEAPDGSIVAGMISDPSSDEDDNDQEVLAEIKKAQESKKQKVEEEKKQK